MSDEEPDRLFKPSSWLVNINFINHLVLLNNILVAVLAEPQGGKTSFIALLQKNLSKECQSLVFSATDWFFSNDLLAKLCIACQIEPDSHTAIGSIIQQINEQKKHFLLIIDDAHYLPLSFLEDLLAAIASYPKSNFFHCCLVANSSLHAHLSMLDRECFANLIHTMPIGVLTERETKTWVLKKTPMLKRSAQKSLTHLYETTQGNIAAINQHMANVHQPKSSSLLSITKGCVAMSCLLMASVWCWKNTNITINAPQTFAHLMHQNTKLPSLNLVSQLPSLTLAPLNRANQSSMFDFLPEDSLNSVNSLALIDSAIALPKSMYRLHANNKASFVSSLVPIGTLLPKKLPVSLSVKPKAASALVDNALKKNDFTIQLLASKNKQQIAYFINRHHLRANARIRLLKRDGHIWYVLTIGQFTHHHDAQIAIQSLPMELSKLKPWIRSSAELKALK